MLKKLDNTKLITAENMHHVFQKSYTVEADLLEAINFPPLQRTIENFAVCKNDFFGYFKDDTLAGKTTTPRAYTKGSEDKREQD